MKKRRLWTAAIAVSAMLAAGVTNASLANSATLSIDCTTAPSMIQVPDGDLVEISGCDEVAWSRTPSSATITVSSATATINPAGMSTSYTGTLTVSGINNGESASLQLWDGGPTGTQYLITLTGVPGGGGGASSDAATSAPVEASLSLDLAASGASCNSGSAAKGFVGTWLTLPSAGDCTSTTKPDAKLLGWSTHANFPVERAQSQVNKGWGAIDEVINGVRMIFIPAGQATFISGPNSLHPIWAN